MCSVTYMYLAHNFFMHTPATIKPLVRLQHGNEFYTFFCLFMIVSAFNGCEHLVYKFCLFLKHFLHTSNVVTKKNDPKTKMHK